MLIRIEPDLNPQTLKFLPSKQNVCCGCSSSAVTLKMSIENILKHYVTEIIKVRLADI